MLVKNLQQFRSAWKKEQGYDMPNWDENFIGSSHQNISGFYKMVNGIVGNIKADLTPKLQNAQDEQAIYEFLQNAADSQSTACAVLYDEDYFMVLNNGKPFSNNDVKAILNTFQGTKADKSKVENCDKIGRYGIGFKLAYRLVGKSDGVNELIADNAGPIIFSWQRKSQLDNLLGLEDDQPIVSQGDISNEDSAPWLLKIVLACFPTVPEEVVKNLALEDEKVFERNEVSALIQFLKKHSHLLKNVDLSKGSLFFLKFGLKKHEKLKESLLNLKSGIGYSLNMLKTMDTVVLQDETVTRYPITFENFAILPGTDDFKRIDPEFPFCPIDLKIGIPSTIEQAKSLKNSPSIYQFFPMRNEQHNLAFFIHGTSFAKITDRTRLDDQGEANVETLKYLSEALLHRMDEFKASDFERYCNIYKAILMSDKPNRHNSDLMNSHLYEPLLQYIRLNIPTYKANTYPKDLVVLKNTKLPVEPIHFGIGKEWFYWSEAGHSLHPEAANTAKLGLRRWSLQEMLEEGNPNLISNWIPKLSENDYLQFVVELKEVQFNDTLLEKFQTIKAFKFQKESGRTTYHSINDLNENPDALLISERTFEIKHILRHLGFSVLEFNLEDYAAIFKSLKTQLEYLTNQTVLFKRIAAKTPSNNLNPVQRRTLFEQMVSWKGLDAKLFKDLELFSNKHGQTAPLKELIAAPVQVEDWLEDFKINEAEDFEALTPYLINASKHTMYQSVVRKYWLTLIKEIDKDDIPELYHTTLNYYKTRRNQENLTSKPYLYINEKIGFVTQEQIFYHRALTDVSFENYGTLGNTIHKITGLHLPDQRILTYMEVEPFKTAVTTTERSWKDLYKDINTRIEAAKLSQNEKWILFDFFNQTISGNDLAKLSLFENANGQLSNLSELLSHEEEVPNWLSNYKIKPSEYNELLEPFLMTSSNVYGSLILPNWTVLIEHEAVKKEPNEFYEKVMYYQSLGRVNRNVTTLPYIYINEEVGFVDSKSCFYHSSLASSEDYVHLKNALEQITDLHLPDEGTLSFLNANPFRTADVRLVRNIKSDEWILTKEEILSLMAFLEPTREDFFNLFCLEEIPDSREYKLLKRGELVQYYVDKKNSKIHEAIEVAFKDKYKRLPSKFYNETYSNRGLVLGKELFNRLSKVSDASMFSALIVETTDAKVQEQVFAKMNRLVLKKGVTYDKDSFEHQVLQAFRNKDANHAVFRRKIVIEDENGKQYRLRDIGFEDTINIAIERYGTYSLSLSSVLPRFTDLQELLNSVQNQFTDFEAPTVLTKRVFYGEGQMPLQTIFTEVQKEYKQLQNAEQLAFVLLYVKNERSNQRLRTFEVMTKLDTWERIAAHEIFYLGAPDFIHQGAVLNTNQYKGLVDTLKLNDKRQSFDVHNQFIALEPTFDKNTFSLMSLRRLGEEEKSSDLQLQILDYIFAQWKDSGIEQIALETREEDNALLGFVPTAHVYPDKFALKEERIPEWMLDWLAEDKMAFLTALGVNTQESDLVQTRNYFQNNEGEVSLKLFNGLRKQESHYLTNTLEWMRANDVRLSSRDDRINWLRRLYGRLNKVTQETPIPIVVDMYDSSFTYQLGDWSADLYLWSEDKIEQVKEKYELAADEIFSELSEANKRFTNIEIKGLELAVGTVEERLDLEDLEEKSTEWATNYYQKWKEEVPYEVYLYEEEMPYRLICLGAEILLFSQGNAILNENRVYVNSQVDNIEEELFAISKYNVFTKGELLPLLRYKNELGAQADTHNVSLSRGIPAPTPPANVIEVNNIEAIEEKQQEQAKGKVQLTFDLAELPAEALAILKQLMPHAEKTEMRID